MFLSEAKALITNHKVSIVPIEHGFYGVEKRHQNPIRFNQRFNSVVQNCKPFLVASTGRILSRNFLSKSVTNDVAGLPVRSISSHLELEFIKASA